MDKKTYITVLTDCNYLPGVYALQCALKRVGSRFPLKVLIPEEMAPILTPSLNQIGVQIETAPSFALPAELLTENSYWNATFFKLRSAGLTQFDKIVLLDSDMLILKNLDHLFDTPSLSAVEDGAPFLKEMHLNSGIMVIEPDKSLEDRWIRQMIPTIEKRKLQKLGTGDQDVIRDAESDWPEKKELHLSPKYNVFLRDVDALCETEYLKNGYEDICVVHFIGPYKPWNYPARKWLSHIKRYVLPYKKYALRAFNEYRRLLKSYRTISSQN